MFARLKKPIRELVAAQEAVESPDAVVRAWMEPLLLHRDNVPDARWFEMTLVAAPQMKPEAAHRELAGTRHETYMLHWALYGHGWAAATGATQRGDLIRQAPLGTTVDEGGCALFAPWCVHGTHVRSNALQTRLFALITAHRCAEVPATLTACEPRPRPPTAYSPSDSAAWERYQVMNQAA